MRVGKRLFVAFSLGALALSPAAIAAEVADYESWLMKDLLLVAEHHGWTLKEAERHYVSTQVVGDIAVAVAKWSPEALVGSAVGLRPDDPPTLYIKGKADEYVRSLVAAAPIPVVLADEQPYSFLELEDRAHQIRRHLGTARYTVAASGVDVTTGLVEVLLERNDGPSTDSAQAIQALPASLRDGVSIEFGHAEHITQAAFGGMWVTLENWANECTSGWSVTQTSTGMTGVTTAAHCDGITNIRHPGHGVHDFPFKSQHLGQWGDVEWHTSPESEPARFYADENAEIRDVTAVEHINHISVNESICVFGRRSMNRHCSTVAVVSFQCAGYAAQRMVLMNGGDTQGGDSGGGWSFNTTAFGSHVGLCQINGVKKADFSVAHYYPSALGVEVRTK